jgi:phosphoglycolate phosphatase-like HAD superfamily hydrolase
MHVVLFDIDGTLIASGGAGRASMEGAMASAFGITALRGDVRYSGRTDRAIGRDLLSMHGLDQSEEAWQRLRSAYLAQLPSCLSRHKGRILPGMSKLLEDLASRSDIVLGLLTGNIREGARIKLSHYRLFDYFALGGYGDHHFDRDDVARDALAEIRAHFNGSMKLDQLWVVGDTPLDIRCARAIQARVVAVATGLHPVEELGAENPDLLLPDFADADPFRRRLGI